MDALDRIESHDWPALEAWARLHEYTLEEAAESFEREYVGDWPNLTRFAYDRAQWEHGLSDWLIPFFDVHAYIDWVFGHDGCFMSIGHSGGVWVFQIKPESAMTEPAIMTRTETDPE
ncbi:MAG: hypothetical protein ACPHFO_08000 [Acidimicrobiales bacterium]